MNDFPEDFGSGIKELLKQRFPDCSFDREKRRVSFSIANQMPLWLDSPQALMLRFCCKVASLGSNAERDLTILRQALAFAHPMSVRYPFTLTSNQNQSALLIVWEFPKHLTMGTIEHYLDQLIVCSKAFKSCLEDIPDRLSSREFDKPVGINDPLGINNQFILRV